MRIIDADELKALREIYIQGKLQFIGNEYDLIDKCPTIDAEPVRHGRWIEDGGFNTCSLCGNSFDRYDDGGYYQDFDYCPKCGAKMDLEKD